MDEYLPVDGSKAPAGIRSLAEVVGALFTSISSFSRLTLPTKVLETADYNVDTAQEFFIQFVSSSCVIISFALS